MCLNQQRLFHSARSLRKVGSSRKFGERFGRKYEAKLTPKFARQQLFSGDRFSSA
jgi:hypothetical protein